MASVVDTGDSLRLVLLGVLLLVGFALSIAWLPALRHDPGGLPARIFVTLGMAVFVVDLGGLGSLLGLSLAAMGLMVWWESRPAPEVPRPHRQGIVLAAAVTGTATYAVLVGWGPFGRLPDEIGVIAAVFVAGAGTVGTLAIADRARVSLRDALRRRFDDVDA
jgi:hypothetical protein